MYGAFWCEHCYRQKQMLGQEAFDKIEYIECSKNGRGSQYKLCREKDVPVCISAIASISQIDEIIIRVTLLGK